MMHILSIAIVLFCSGFNMASVLFNYKTLPKWILIMQALLGIWCLVLGLLWMLWGTSCT